MSPALALFILLIVLAAALVWNFYPPLRARMRGFSTIVEIVIGLALAWLGILAEAAQELHAAGFIPDGYERYVPWLMTVYFIVKRIQTRTPVGGAR